MTLYALVLVLEDHQSAVVVGVGYRQHQVEGRLLTDVQPFLAHADCFEEVAYPACHFDPVEVLGEGHLVERGRTSLVLVIDGRAKLLGVCPDAGSDGSKGLDDLDFTVLLVPEVISVVELVFAGTPKIEKLQPEFLDKSPYLSVFAVDELATQLSREPRCQEVAGRADPAAHALGSFVDDGLPTVLLESIRSCEAGQSGAHDDDPRIAFRVAWGLTPENAAGAGQRERGCC